MKVATWKYLGQQVSALCAGLLVATLVMNGLAHQAQAQLATWTNGGGAGTGDFFDGANWDIGVPGATNAALIDGGGTATIDSTGTGAGATVGSLQSGSAVGTSGSFQMDSGFLQLLETSSIGASTGSSGSFIMNGGTIHNGDVTGTVGLQSSLPNVDLVFANSGDSTTVFEMHGDAEYRGVDDMTLGNHNFSGPLGMAATSAATMIMDGNSVYSQADGLGTRGTMNMTLSDNAQMTLGNSMGPANPAGAWAENSGWINLGSRDGGTVDMIIEDNAEFNATRMQHNVGVATVTIRGNGEFNLFNTGTGGTHTDFKGQNFLSRDSGNAANGQATATFILQDAGKFTVDSDAVTHNGVAPGDTGWDGHADLLPQSGLILAGGDDESVEIGSGNPGGNNYRGGVVVIDINDSAEFSIVQDLWMTYGNSANASSTVKVTGPDATVSIGEDLNMAVVIDQFINRTPTIPVVVFGAELYIDTAGDAVLHSVITGSAHSVIDVGDEARIGNGQLVVELDGYSPVLGDSYTLIQTGNSAGVLGEFSDVDLSLASLSGGLGWSLDYFANSVVLSVVPEPSSMLLAFAAAACFLGKSRSSRS